ncbi:CopG family transcriptional regulator [Eggerthellaceae bacterium zg-887]|uniref:type II toxin-antitoxin system RelB family antitoxin n=1 Tax=Xiamenia xianingshaonis TaxID=2682776 RepID=UPI00140ADABA|nr:DUF6290 family protein [Xiamenia xianingshaonis]NHM16087.1 CopG family transcriptional regulator [Xiamenia xianingshaonis]
MLEATMTVRLDEGEKTLIADYAHTLGTSASQLMRRCTLERIEDEIDVDAYRAAKAEFDKNPISYSNDEVLREFGLP